MVEYIFLPFLPSMVTSKKKTHPLFLLTSNIEPSLHHPFKSLTLLQTLLNNNQHAVSFITRFAKEEEQYNMPI